MNAYKINKRIEDIFSIAAALQQSGKLKNTIYCIKDRIFILNQDNTILLRFPLRDSEIIFENPVAFLANDYDSNVFYEKDGFINFIKENKDYVRVKSCKSPTFSPKEINTLWKANLDVLEPTNRVDIGLNLREFLEEELSHIEFSCEKDSLKIVQRDIYSGSVSSTQTKNYQDFLSKDSLKSFEPIGIRTNDFLALFSFVDMISFYFVSKDKIWFESKDRGMPFQGILALCSYDELGRIEE